MATIEAYSAADGSKRYRVRYRTPDHRQTAKRGFRTKREAETFAAEVEVRKARGEYVDASAGRLTVADAGEAWLNGRALSPGTLAAYRSSWKVHVLPRWGSTPLASIRFSEVEAWVAQLSAVKSPTTVRRAHDILAGILDSAVRDRRISANPARGVTLPRKAARARVYLNAAEVETLAGAAGEHGLIVRLLAYTGIRWGELAGLHVGDVNVLRSRLVIRRSASLVAGSVQVGATKTGRVREVPVPPSIMAELSRAIEHRGPDDIVFPARAGGYRRTPTVTGYSWWDAAKAAAHAPASLRIHDLRHTAASLAISAGAHAKVVQRMLGHASAAMTLDTYADLFDDDLDIVSSALDQARASASVSKMCPDGADDASLTPALVANFPVK